MPSQLLSALRVRNLFSLLLTLSISAHLTLQYNKQIMTNINGVEVMNVCNTDVLKHIIPHFDPDPGQIYQGWKSDFGVQTFCPNQKYTCCSSSQMERMFDFYTRSLHYTRYREDVFLSMFRTVLEIDDKSFLDFLKTLTEADKTCYIERGKEVGEERNPENLSKELIRLKPQMKMFEETMLKAQEDRERFYGSLICLSCSPLMSKVFLKQSNGEYQLSINQQICQDVALKRTDKLKSMLPIASLQKIVDVTLCVQKNSRSKGPDSYSKHHPDDWYSFGVNVDVVKNMIKNSDYCLKKHNSFIIPDSESGVDCQKICKQGITLFTNKYTDMRNIMIIENDIYNMLIGAGKDNDRVDRLAKKMKEYTFKRDQLLRTNNIDNVSSSGKHKVYFLQFFGGDDLKMESIDFEIERFGGFNVSEIYPNPEMYNGLGGLAGWLVWGMVILAVLA